MSYPLDVEQFINEVKKYPVIWDLNCEDNRYKKRKQRAWEEIARILIEEIEHMSNTQKMEVYRTLCGKWRNIRDSYVRHLKQRYGKRGYKHAKHLSFLSSIYTQNNQSGSEVEADDTWHSETDENRSKNSLKIFDVKSDLIWTSDAEDEQPLTNSGKRKKPRNAFEYVEAFPEAACSFNAEDDDRSFFESLLPAIRTLDVDQKLEFRSQVLKLVQELRTSAKKIKVESRDESIVI